ncbi:MAG: hypothetical protein CMH30_08520 [Micavibrio sp.]|nr:hypothetical protein [Micavibrio sp.]|tara:strand:- start:546 stop:1163 length:618 start_codon:yes stop_codon:yes gene_type:complete
MRKIPVRKVYIGFVGSDVLPIAMDRTSSARPKDIDDYVSRHFEFQMESTSELEDIDAATMFVHMDANKNEISFKLAEWQDIYSDDFSFTPTHIKEFKISLPRACGAKEWKAYLDGKEVYRGEIKNVFEGEASWMAQENLHNALALRLNNWLERKGLFDFVYQGDSFEDQSLKLDFARKLITLFVDYRAIYKNVPAIKSALAVAPR